MTAPAVRRLAAAALAGALLAGALAATGATAPTRHRAAVHPGATARRRPARSAATAHTSKPPAAIAQDIEAYEELGAYRQAAAALGDLRRAVKPDADLDLSLALDLARSGAVDSAATVLAEPLLTAALHDTADFHRFQFYGFRHEMTYLDGRFDGWYWYVARARAEIAMARGRWDDARTAARTCVRARPLAGVEWALLALCAAHAGTLDEATAAAARAVRLDPILPEAQYLDGLFAWKAGRRAAAAERFRTAIGLDSSYRAPALALVRTRLPVAPDSLPDRLLHGIRACALLTTGLQPKFDDYLQLDGPVTIVQSDSVALPDSLAGRVKPFTVHESALIDTTGTVAYYEEPWTGAGTLPDDVVALISESMRGWRVTPGRRNGRPQPLWLELDVDVRH